LVLLTNPLNNDHFDPRIIVEWLAGFEDSPMWAVFTMSRVGLAAGLAVMAVVLYLITWTFIPLGQILGQSLRDHPRTIRAYSVNISGSLAGVWLFNALSTMATPPSVWFAVVFLMLVLLTATLPERNWWAAALVVVGIGLIVLQSGRELETMWSPYQKIQVKGLYHHSPAGRVQIGYQVGANGLEYRTMVNLSDEFLAAHPGLVDRQLVPFGYYDFPFRIKPVVRRLLVVGAGCGNNAAGALRNEVEQVDCVEIDPQIFAMGR
jgi:hypothetical protein